jgi:hypothetical protein
MNQKKFLEKIKSINLDKCPDCNFDFGYGYLKKVRSWCCINPNVGRACVSISNLDGSDDLEIWRSYNGMFIALSNSITLEHYWVGSDVVPDFDPIPIDRKLISADDLTKQPMTILWPKIQKILLLQ